MCFPWCVCVKSCKAPASTAMGHSLVSSTCRLPTLRRCSTPRQYWPQTHHLMSSEGKYDALHISVMFGEYLRHWNLASSSNDDRMRVGQGSPQRQVRPQEFNKPRSEGHLPAGMQQLCGWGDCFSCTLKKTRPILSSHFSWLRSTWPVNHEAVTVHPQQRLSWPENLQR